MEQLVLIVHVLAAIAIIVLILLQQGKGASMGASFGAGASQTLFGSQGSANFFSRATAIIAVLFFATSFGLAVIAKEMASVSGDLGIPGLEESDVPVVEEPETQSDIPVINEAPTEAADDVIPSVDDSAAPAETPEEESATETEQ